MASGDDGGAVTPRAEDHAPAGGVRPGPRGPRTPKFTTSNSKIRSFSSELLFVPRFRKADGDNPDLPTWSPQYCPVPLPLTESWRVPRSDLALDMHVQASVQWNHDARRCPLVEPHECQFGLIVGNLQGPAHQTHPCEHARIRNVHLCLDKLSKTCLDTRHDWINVPVVRLLVGDCSLSYQEALTCTKPSVVPTPNFTAVQRSAVQARWHVFRSRNELLGPICFVLGGGVIDSHPVRGCLTLSIPGNVTSIAIRPLPALINSYQPPAAPADRNDGQHTPQEDAEIKDSVTPAPSPQPALIQSSQPDRNDGHHILQEAVVIPLPPFSMKRFCDEWTPGDTLPPIVVNALKRLKGAPFNVLPRQL